jgi:hypothetical protein
VPHVVVAQDVAVHDITGPEVHVGMVSGVLAYRHQDAWIQVAESEQTASIPLVRGRLYELIDATKRGGARGSVG